VANRFVYWPFWIPQLLCGLPLLAALLWRQARANTPTRALWGYGLFLFVFFYVSRFMNENYLGYILALLALGALMEPVPAQPAGAVPGAGDSDGGAL
ncbi:MAG: hypothetical protein N2439_09375, partial [Anaerolineae bacterium]|nr:hypothetical protein [Anaerolineae bacterium]